MGACAVSGVLVRVAGAFRIRLDMSHAGPEPALVLHTLMRLGPRSRGSWPEARSRRRWARVVRLLLEGHWSGSPGRHSPGGAVRPAPGPATGRVSGGPHRGLSRSLWPLRLHGCAAGCWGCQGEGGDHEVHVKDTTATVLVAAVVVPHVATWCAGACRSFRTRVAWQRRAGAGRCGRAPRGSAVVRPRCAAAYGAAHRDGRPRTGRRGAVDGERGPAGDVRGSDRADLGPR